MLLSFLIIIINSLGCPFITMHISCTKIDNRIVNFTIIVVVFVLIITTYVASIAIFSVDNLMNLPNIKQRRSNHTCSVCLEQSKGLYLILSAREITRCLWRCWDFCQLLCYWGLMTTQVCVNIGPGNGFLFDNTKPLLDSLLTYHQWSPVEFTWEHFIENAH